MTTLREELIKIGTKVVRHAKYVTVQMAKVAVPREDRETRQNSRGEPQVQLSPGVTHREHATIGDSIAAGDIVPTPREPGLPPHVLEMIRRLYGVDLVVKEATKRLREISTASVSDRLMDEATKREMRR